MVYTVTEAWSNGDESVSVCFTTKTPLVFSESGVALMKQGYFFKEREWHPQTSKQEIIEKSLNEIEKRQEAINGKQ